MLTAFNKNLSSNANRLGNLYESSHKEEFSLLRKRFSKDGYLFLKGILKKNDVISFREWVFNKLQNTGLLKENINSKFGIVNNKINHNIDDAKFLESGRSQNSLIKNAISLIVKSKRYEEFCSQPLLVNFVKKLIGGDIYLHKRKILRHTIPQSNNSTPAHYDLIYLRAGTDNIITVWIPIGDIDIAEGGLMYLEGSHAQGIKMEDEFSKKNANLSKEEQINAFNKNMTEGGWISKNLPNLAEKFNTRWLVTNYEAGDILIHSPYLIHASTNNKSLKERIRLSTDIRFQNIDDKIDIRWNNHWNEDDNL